MLFPKNRIRFTTTFQGKSDSEGWIVLNLIGADLEGASNITLSMAELIKLRELGDKQSDKLKEARELLGGISEED